MEALAIDGTKIWPDDINLQVGLKKHADIWIKCNMRQKLVNDRYRVTFIYKNVKQAKEFAEKLVRIAHDKHEMALIKYDFNLNDVSNLQSAKIYVCFKKDNIDRELIDLVTKPVLRNRLGWKTKLI